MNDPARRPPDARLHRGSGDAWVDCACGNRHWGSNGAAGLLLWRADPSGTQILLQHRALWSHHGGTWGLPGGALHDGETPVAGAIREAGEEAGVIPQALRVRAVRDLVHPDWSYTTVLAEAVAPFEPRASDAETLDVRWVGVEDLDGHELLPAFADALPELRAMLRTLVLVVDAANVVGSRPDGWWADRRGATARLRDHLSGLSRRGLAAADAHLPGRLWFPEVVLVTEGEARGIAPVDGVRVVSAEGSGDDAVVATVRSLAERPGTRDIAVATADRELTDRVQALGARTLGPRVVRH